MQLLLFKDLHLGYDGLMKTPPSAKRFSILLTKQQWKHLDLIVRRRKLTMRSCLDDLVSDIPEGLADFNRWIQETLPVRRRWGQNQVKRSVSISSAGWQKLGRLAAFSILSVSPACPPTSKVNRDKSAILRAALSDYFRKDREEHAGDRGDGRAEFFHKPVAIDGLGREVFVGLPSLKELPEECPVLVDHSILLLSVLHLEMEKNGLFRFEFDADPWRPMSWDCVNLLKTADKRDVLIHPIHLSLFLSDLARLVRGLKNATFLDSNRKKTTELGYLLSKAAQLEDLELQKLRYVSNVSCSLSGSADTFPTMLAVTSAKMYLGERQFAFATAFHPRESVEGVKIYCPTDYPRGRKTTQVNVNHTPMSEPEKPKKIFSTPPANDLKNS